jgi:integrase
MWIFQCQVNGRTWNRSTGETNRKRAEAKIPELQRLAELHRKLPKDISNLKAAIIGELNRVEKTVSEHEAQRLDFALRKFAEWAGDVALEIITTRMLEDYQIHRSRKAALNTINREIHSVLRLLRRNGFMVQKPEPIRGRRTRNRAFTAEELERFFQHCNEAQQVLFLLMLTTGARPAELIPSERSNHVPLLKSEIDVDKRLIKLRGAKQKVGQKDVVRLIEVPAELMRDLAVFARKVEGPFVFPRRNSGLKNTFDRILKKAGIEKLDVLGQKLTAHSFRHTYATLMAQAVGNNPFILKQARGHSQISTTDRYCHSQAPAVVIDIAPYMGRVKDPCKKEAPAEAEAS